MAYVWAGGLEGFEMSLKILESGNFLLRWGMWHASFVCYDMCVSHLDGVIMILHEIER